MADRNAEETADIKKFFVEFGKESDRAAVILGAAKLDILLYQILQRYFIAETGSSDELLDGDHPLGTFSAKIKIAYRLGLIDRDITKSLNLIRRIRNSFAHELSGISLDNGGHRDRVKELVAPFHPYPDYQEFLDAFFGGKSGPSTEFRNVVAVLAMRLTGLFRSIEPLSDKDAFDMIPPAWEKRKRKPLKPSAKTTEKPTAKPVAKPTAKPAAKPTPR